MAMISTNKHTAKTNKEDQPTNWIGYEWVCEYGDGSYEPKTAYKLFLHPKIIHSLPLHFIR